MTLLEAVAALLDEYELAGFEDLIRDEVKGDPAFDGLSQDHPRVRRWREICRTLREAVPRA